VGNQYSVLGGSTGGPDLGLDKHENRAYFYIRTKEPISRGASVNDESSHVTGWDDKPNNLME
jgi:hypothetical protein